jgi:LysR family transcriptional regulator for bpeEF and oprC
MKAKVCRASSWPRAPSITWWPRDRSARATARPTHPLAGDLPDTLIARRVGRARLGLYGSPDYLARRGTPLHPLDIPAHDCLRYTGLGRLVLLPCFLVQPALRAGTLRTLLPEWRSPDIDVYLTYASRRNQPQRVRALIDVLARHFEAAPFDPEVSAA